MPVDHRGCIGSKILKERRFGVLQFEVTWLLCSDFVFLIKPPIPICVRIVSSQLTLFHGLDAACSIILRRNSTMKMPVEPPRCEEPALPSFQPEAGEPQPNQND